MVAPDATDVTEPLSVILPDVVTVPDKDRPFAEPVPPTEVTVPVVELVPAPIALRNVAASRADTVLSALKRGNVIADGLTRVNTLAPTVVAPSDVRAADGVVAPVPPLAIGSVPVTCEGEAKLTPESDPPSVSEPEPVTEPVRVIPLTLPVPPTEVTVPLPVPAPRLVRAVAASVAPVPPCATDNAVVKPVSDVMSEFAPEPAAPRLSLAPEALVAPVPPDTIASVPASVSVPEVVMGVPVKERPVVPPDAATEVTVPLPAVDAMVMPPALFVMLMPDPAVRVAFVSVLPVLLPMSNCPSVYVV